MGYEMHPNVLPDATRRAIFGFEQHAFPGLVLAACVEGSLAEMSTDRVLPEQPTIQDLETWIPAAPQDTMTPGKKPKDVVASLLRSWRQKYAPRIPQNGTVLEVETAGNTLSPFNAKEQKAMVEYVGGYIRKHLSLQRIVWNNYDWPEASQVFSYLNAMLLGTVSDIAAMPRIMAGMDFDRERSALIGKVKQDYDIDQHGVISTRNEKQPPARNLVESLIWKKPCQDLSPTYGSLGSLVGIHMMKRPMLQMIEVLGMAAEANPARLRTPLEEAMPTEFHTPFRVNSYRLLKRALEVYADDKKKVLDAFFEGEAIELPRGIYLDTVQTAQRRETLMDEHRTVMQNLREKELGQQMIGLVMNPGNGPLELKRGDDLEPCRLSQFLAQRLKNIARILHDLSPDSDIVAPSISLTKDPSKLLEGLMGDYYWEDVKALHLVMHPKNKPARDLDVSQPFHIGAIVEKGTEYRRSSFSGIYFTIALNGKANFGVRKIKVKVRRTPMSELTATKLMCPTPKPPEVV